MRRRKLLVALAGLAVVAAGAVVLWPEPPSRITRENFDRIREGMTQAEVEAILGPPGDYRTRLGDTKYQQGWQTDVDEYEDPTIATWNRLLHGGGVSVADWVGDTIWVQVFANDARVVARAFGFERRRNGHALDNLLWRAKRQWHRWFP
jgi:hypothetical protein